MVVIFLYAIIILHDSVVFSWSTTSGVWKHFNAAHATDADLVFHCDYCAAKFPNKNLLNNHRKTKHLTR